MLTGPLPDRISQLFAIVQLVQLDQLDLNLLRIKLWVVAAYGIARHRS